MTASPPDYLLFAAGTALFFGLGPILSKRGLAGGGTWMGNTLTVIGLRAVLVWIVLLATAPGDALDGVTIEVALVFGLAGIAASGMGRLLFYVGVDRVGSSLSNAVSNARPLFAVALAAVWLGEAVTVEMVGGVALIVGGLVTLSLSRGGDVGGWSRVDLTFPLIAALLFALGNVGRSFGFRLADIPVLPAVAIGETAALVVVVGYAAATGRMGELRVGRRVHGLFAGAGVIATLGLFLLFEALRRGPVSVVDPIVATAPLVTVALAVVFLRDFERVTAGLALGSAVVVIGVVLVT